MKNIVGLDLHRHLVLIFFITSVFGCNTDKKESGNAIDSSSNKDTLPTIIKGIKGNDTVVLKKIIPAPELPVVQSTLKFVAPVIVDEIQERTDVNAEIETGEEIAMDIEGEGDIDLPIISSDAGDVFLAVQEMPGFVGGEAAMMQFIKDNLKYPEMAQTDGVEGKVRVKFTVNKNGTLSDFHIISKEKLGYGLEEEAIRIIKSMPKWNPGKQNGNAVNVYYNLPITFRLF